MDIFDMYDEFMIADDEEYSSYHGEIVDEYDDDCFDYVVYADGYVAQYGKN